MKNRMIVLALLCFSVVVQAQEPVKLNVIYEFTYVRDLANPANPYRGNMVLSLGKKTSRFSPQKLFNDNDKKALEARKREEEKMDGAPSGSMPVVTGRPMLIVGKGGVAINEETSKDFSKDKISTDIKLGLRTYHVETKLPRISWSVQSETKKIGNYTCQKASGEFGGRNYEAWFTTEIPYRDGPWKLSGLPGLILEARDTAGEIAFVFKEISKNDDDGETTNSFLFSPYSINTNARDLLIARKAFETDPEGVMGAQAPNARLAIRNLDDPGDKVVVRIKKYNAMELR